MNVNKLEIQLNAEFVEDRLAALTELMKLVEQGDLPTPIKEGYTNNHVHTKYSFSPYSPTKTIWMGFKAGLDTIGIMDHDSLSGAKEFIKAGKIVGIATTIGFEMRTDWSNTILSGRRINNPDQKTSAYIACHGIPHTMIDRAIEFLTPQRDARNIRNRAEVEKINKIVSPYGINMDFDSDVIPLSYNHDGGSITERHILFALTKLMIAKVGRGQSLVDLLETNMGLPLSESQKNYLLDISCDIYEYDVLNVLKGHFVNDIYIKTQLDEAPYVKEAVAFIKSIGGISSYCYLGDVGASPTGDKKEQKFEDDYLEEVLQACTEIGFNAIAYMPSRNTTDQLIRVMELCDKHEFMQICGEDINQPRQSFICKQLKNDIFSHLTISTWALVGHELSSTKDNNMGLFKNTDKPLIDRLREYATYGKDTE